MTLLARRRLTSWIGIAGANVLVLAALLLLVEGLASYLHVGRDVVTATPIAERRTLLESSPPRERRERACQDPVTATPTQGPTT